MSKIRIGIIFGGQSREREVSFAGGRTVYDNLDKSMFEAIPLFVDSFGGMVVLNWENVYKGSIRDFYPPQEFIPEIEMGFQVYAENLDAETALGQVVPDKLDKIKAESQSDSQMNLLIQRAFQYEMLQRIGEPISAEDLSLYIDFAFLALHGTPGEDGSIQGLLEWNNIPYSGSGILPSAIGINKSAQKYFQLTSGLFVNEFETLQSNVWLESSEQEKQNWFLHFNMKFGGKFVIKPAHQGSSLGVGILKDADYARFCHAIDLAFFRMQFNADDFKQLSESEQLENVKWLTDIRSGLGLPIRVNGELIKRPDTLYQYLLNQTGEILLQATDSESEVIIESYIEGKEFSCIVVENTLGDVLALPPTEIRKPGDLFDYRSKYLPGLSNKVTPIEVSEEVLGDIRSACCDLYHYFGFEVYARIDGFVNDEGEIFLNDPNTTSGMMPSSFFFHQAAEIGLNPSQFLTFIIHNSLKNRIHKHPKGQQYNGLLVLLEQLLDNRQLPGLAKRKLGIIMGGYSFERHISMESGRNIYEKISSSEEFQPVPLFLTGNSQGYKLHLLPLNMMLKDNADDIRDKVLHYEANILLNDIRQEAEDITSLYNSDGALFVPEEVSLDWLKENVEGVFIALHGRPGEDGTIQRDLTHNGIYFNGSEAHSAEITINKFETNKKLRELGFLVADHEMVQKSEFYENKEALCLRIVQTFGLPLIAKPADDGCSAAVRKIKSAEELQDFMSLIFRNNIDIPEDLAANLGISPHDEMPLKQELLIEKFIDKENCVRFLEVTGGLLTHLTESGELKYEVFEPSESLAESEILSLEEKFLAGEGQNLTPARFSKDAVLQQAISMKVRNTLESVAKALEVTGYCRIDAFIRIFENDTIETIIIEVNSLPGMTPATCIYHQAAINGYKPYDFIREILNYGKQRNNIA